eukprot:1786590-Pleurochrysis_carterae.AAC.1
MAKEAAKEAESLQGSSSKGQGQGQVQGRDWEWKGQGCAGQNCWPSHQNPIDESDWDESNCGTGSSSSDEPMPLPMPLPPPTKRKPPALAPAPAPAAALKKGRVRFAAGDGAPATPDGAPAAEGANAGLGAAVDLLAEMQRQNLLLIEQMKDVVQRCSGGGSSSGNN